MADTRIFRITRVRRQYRTGQVIDSTVWYGNKRVTSGKASRGSYDGLVEKIEATNAEATEGWTDVTEEFRHLIGEPR
jgi:hypothetical protein